MNKYLVAWKNNSKSVHFTKVFPERSSNIVLFFKTSDNAIMISDIKENNIKLLLYLIIPVFIIKMLLAKLLVCTDIFFYFHFNKGEFSMKLVIFHL